MIEAIHHTYKTAWPGPWETCDNIDWSWCNTYWTDQSLGFPLVPRFPDYDYEWACTFMMQSIVHSALFGYLYSYAAIQW